MEKLKQISCDPMCGFKVRSHDEKEVVELTKLHAKKVHPDKNYTEKDIRTLLETVKG